MRERPILFSGSMVQAILAGRKTQTRRIIKGDFFIENTPPLTAYIPDYIHGKSEPVILRCPYGEVGDRLWVRETFAPTKPEWGLDVDFVYQADHLDLEGDAERIKWNPSIFMPRSASRITLEIINIRIEKLNNISEEDAIAEGVEAPQDNLASDSWKYPKLWRNYSFNENDDFPDPALSAIQSFQTLWESINGKKRPWKSNPWVWVIEFEEIKIKEPQGDR